MSNIKTNLTYKYINQAKPCLFINLHQFALNVLQTCNVVRSNNVNDFKIAQKFFFSFHKIQNPIKTIHNSSLFKCFNFFHRMQSSTGNKNTIQFDIHSPIPWIYLNLFQNFTRSLEVHKNVNQSIFSVEIFFCCHFFFHDFLLSYLKNVWLI